MSEKYYWMQKSDFEDLGITNVIELETPVSMINEYFVAAITYKIKKDKLEDEAWFNDLKHINGVLIIKSMDNDEYSVPLKEAECVMFRIFEFK